jgi:hypothetical protein
MSRDVKINDVEQEQTGEQPMRIIPTQTESPPLKTAQMMGQVYRYHVMIKPSGAQCNLDCSYCFYLHKQDMLHQPKTPRMAESLLELHIKQYIQAKPPMKWCLAGKVANRR